MNKPVNPLIKDDFTGEPPTSRVLSYVQKHREHGKPVAGIYCGYAPLELLHALDIVPAVLCAFSDKPISKAEESLPANLCPLIKSSYGFILTDTCPFFPLSDCVIAETTCDGKKKMFELISEYKPLHVMDLPQLPDEEEAKANWTNMIIKLENFLKETFSIDCSGEDIEREIKATNEKNRQMREIFEYAALDSPVITWSEIFELAFFGLSAKGCDTQPVLSNVLTELENRKKAGYSICDSGTPRVMVTGCPVGGDATKIYRIIEEAGGAVVALDACTGMKAFMLDTEENTGDPYRAIAEKYLKIPCSCMTPNNRRITETDRMIDKFKPDVIIDFVLHACHSYNVESYKIGRHVTEKHNIPYLKIESDYSDSDIEQIRTRIEAVFESL